MIIFIIRGCVAGKDGIDERDGIGFKLTDDGDDIQDKKIMYNIHRGTQNDHAIVLSQYEEGLNTKIDKTFLSSSSKNKGLGKIPSYDPYNALFCKEINIGDNYNDTADIRPRN